MNYYKRGTGVVFTPPDTPYGWEYSEEADAFVPADMADIEILKAEDLIAPATEKEFSNDIRLKTNNLGVWNQKAINLAKQYHAGQVDKSGRPYFDHLKRVAELATNLFGGGYLTIVAYLHDILEDTQMTEEKLREEFPMEIVDAVVSMTHKRGETYPEYIQRVIKNPLAKRVKICDLTHNMDLERIDDPTERDHQRIKKYQRALSKILKTF
jgi:(p)ppGpp synthase/HD superfamily hydrolase